METVLEVRNLKKSYKVPFSNKKVEALKGVSFKIEAGTITGFLGANGAGKSTTIKCLLELSFADAGEIFYFGTKGLSKEVKSRIGFLPEHPYFYDYLTGREFLKFYGELSSRISSRVLQSRIVEILERVGLAHAVDRPLRGYSKGMLQRIGIAQALIHQPEFIILDEPMTGLDPDGRNEVRDIIREVAGRGTAVFFSSHLLPDAETLCDSLVILKKGDLIYHGRTDTLMKQMISQWKILYRSSTAMNENPIHEFKKNDSFDITTGLFTRVLDSEVAVQSGIDEIRKAGLLVVEVAPVRVSLEEIFTKIAFDK